MKFDPTISMGHVLTAVVILMGGLGVYVRMEINLADVTKDVVIIKRDVAEVKGDVAWLKRQAETRVGGR